MKKRIILSVIFFYLYSISNNIYSMGIRLGAEDIFDDEKVVKLIKYVKSGNDEEVKGLINEGVNIDYEGYRKITPLYHFFMQKDYKSFKKMLELGANPNVAPEGISLYGLLNFTMEIKDDRYFKILLEYNANINFISKIDERPLHFASLYDSVDIKYLKMLIEKGVNPYYYDSKEEIEKYWPDVPVLTTLSGRGYKKAILLLEYYPDYLKDERIKKCLIEDVERHSETIGSKYYKEHLELAKYLKDKFGIEVKLCYDKYK